VFPAIERLLKRGALVVAANWPVVIIQAVTNSLFTIVVAAPLLGGIVLVTLVVGGDPGVLVSLGWRELLPTLVAALQSRPLVLASFLAAVAVVVVGGSLVVFLVKAGTIAVLVRAEREAGPVEEPPLRVEVLGTASAFTVERFIESARWLFPRYARLGLGLLAVYLASGAIFVTVIVASPSGWTGSALATAVLGLWITVVNLVYLLLQIVVATDDCGVATAGRRVAGFLRHDHRRVAGVLLVVLALLVFATGASIVAAALLGLIAFVPLVGLAVLPLQLTAWLLRGLVFEYIQLASVAAYVRAYRAHAHEVADGWPADAGLRTPVLRHAGGAHER
jgi:hypothetical protein